MSQYNILLITSDQQHWNTIGKFNPELKTPSLNRLADEGTVFTRTYCPNPTCTPTRSSMITGKYPSQHGAYSLGTKLPESEQTLGSILQNKGYRTALVGKTHFQPLRGTKEFPSLESYPLLQDLNFWRNFNGPFYGFEHVEVARNHTDEPHVGQHYAIWMEENGFAEWRDYFRGPTGNNNSQKRKWLIPEKYHYNAWISERTNALLSGFHEKNEPFFMWASFFDPHPDYLVPEPWDTMYDPESLTIPQIVPGEHRTSPSYLQMTQQANPDYSDFEEVNGNAMHGFHSHLRDHDELAKDIAIYYGMVSCLDHYVGKIINHLNRLGLAENTLIVYTSDHGHYYGHHGLIAKGSFHYDDGIRVPMIARLPGQIPAGKIGDTLQCLVDFAPTFLAFADCLVPEDMTGINQKNVWLGDIPVVRQHVVVENRHQPTTIHMKTYIDERYKITIHYQRDYGEIYDLKHDPGEITNLWADKDLRAMLTEKLLRAEILKEESLSEETKKLAHKSESMYIKSYNKGRFQINFSPGQDCSELFDLFEDAACSRNLWNEENYQDIRRDMVLALLFGRWGLEPLWMPRIAVA